MIDYKDFSDEELIEHVNELNNDININYHNDKPKTIFLDYGGANVAKSLHSGHLRSPNMLCLKISMLMNVFALLGIYGTDFALPIKMLWMK